jgi:hypothetical protein
MNDQVDVAEQRPVRFCGVYRSDQHGVVGACDASLLGRGVPEGTLAHLVHKSFTDEAWKVAIARLLDWKFAELEAGFKGGALRVVLTELGVYWAQELCGQRQLDGKPVDGE